MVARFCYNNGINFNQFYEWYKAKNDSDEKRNKWVGQWNKLDEFPSVNITQIMYVLEKYYPNITKKRELLAFMKICSIDEIPFKEIISLDQDHFDNKTKKPIFKIGMGGGKTFQTIEYLRKNCNNDNDNDNFIWMTPNIALADNTFERMKDFHTTHLYNEEKKKEKSKY